MDITFGTRVELTDGPAAGWQGVVRDRKEINGVWEAHVEWDHGEAWTWTAMARLSVLDAPVPDETVGERIMRDAYARRDEERCPTCGREDEEDPFTDTAERFVASAEKAFEKIIDSDGFFVVTVNRGPHPNHPEVTALIPSLMGDFLHDSALDVIEAQITYLAALQHQQIVIDKLKKSGEDA